MSYAYLEFKVISFLGLKNMHMHLEISSFWCFDGPNTQNHGKKVGRVQIVFVL
jgi:hypothetical protein